MNWEKRVNIVDNFWIVSPATDKYPQGFVACEGGDLSGSPDLMKAALNGAKFGYFIREFGCAIELPASKTPWHWYHFGLEELRCRVSNELDLYIEGVAPRMPREVKGMINRMSRKEGDTRVF